MLLAIVGWVLVGLVLGFIVSRVVDLRGDDPRLGIGLSALAALVGGWLFSMISGSPFTFFTFWSWLVAAIAASLAMAVWHVVRHRTPYKRPTFRQSY